MQIHFCKEKPCLERDKEIINLLENSFKLNFVDLEIQKTRNRMLNIIIDNLRKRINPHFLSDENNLSKHNFK